MYHPCTNLGFVWDVKVLNLRFDAYIFYKSLICIECMQSQDLSVNDL